MESFYYHSCKSAKSAELLKYINYMMGLKNDNCNVLPGNSYVTYIKLSIIINL